MIIRGSSIRRAVCRACAPIPAVALLLASLTPAGAVTTGPASDVFGSAVVAYRTGDHTRALEGWRALADEGNALAQYNVGLLHYLGHGTARSYAQALIWFHAAARQGLAASYLRLGGMFERGEGVPRDFEQSYLWYTLAVSAFGPGSCRDTALDRRRTLAKSLTEAQILKVLAESSEWAPGPLAGTGQPCFNSIALRPADGIEETKALAVESPKATVAAAPSKPPAGATSAKPPRVATATKTSSAPPSSKTSAVDGAPKFASRTQNSELVVEPRNNESAEAKQVETAKPVAPTLMAQLPAKMPGGKEHAKVPGLAAAEPPQESQAKAAEPLPTVDVAKRKVHKAKAPDEGYIPMVGASTRRTNPPRREALALGPVAEKAGSAVSMSAPSRAVPSQYASSARVPSQVAGSVDRTPPKPLRVARATPPAAKSDRSAMDRGVYVQLGALSTSKMAEQVWRRLSERNGDIIGRYRSEIEKVRIKGGKVLYRLYAGPFDSDGRADAFCDSLKRRNEDCFVPPRFRTRR